MTNRRFLLLALSAAALLGACASPPPHAPIATLLDESLAGPQRSEANKARDGYRHPKETLLFFGVKPEQTVIEISPGGGWYTEILAPLLRERGAYYVAVDPADGTPQEINSRLRFQTKLQTLPSVFDRVKLVTMPTTATIKDLPAPGQADVVLTFRNIHNWIEAGHLDETLRAFNAALKPGGVLGVEEHRAPAGTSLERIIASGYVPEDYVIEHAKTAGFELVGRSEINANPKDTKDHPKGVWSLPPTLLGGAFGREQFLAIGESDRMTLKFIKTSR